MATGAFSDGFDRLYGARVLTTAMALWYFRGGFRVAWRGTSWQAIGLGSVAFVLWVWLTPRPIGEWH